MVLIFEGVVNIKVKISSQLFVPPDADTNHQSKAIAKANVEKTSKEIVISCCFAKNNLDRGKSTKNAENIVSLRV